MNIKRFGHSVASILLLIVAAFLIGVGNARADQSAEDHAAHHPKVAKAVGAAVAPTTRPSETVEELRAKIAKLEAQLKEKTGGMGMGMMMGGGKEGGGMGMKGMGMMGGKDSPQGIGMSCCMCEGPMMMKDQQQKAPTTQPQHSHDHK